MKKIALLAFILPFLFAVEALAWWSVPANVSGSTHYRITNAAQDSIGLNYPDVTIKFNTFLRSSTSGSKDDARAHGGTAIPNDGPIEDWLDFAKDQYKLGNLDAEEWSAYYYIALAMHLIEDQAVPAHAYNIQHGGLGYMDNMEQLVNYHFSPSSSSIVFTNSPISSYNEMSSFTLAATANAYWQQYWLSGFPRDVVINDGTYHFDGAYGGPPEEYTEYQPDVFPESWLLAGEAERNLSSQLTGAAIGHTAGALIAISTSLPPLVKDLDISSFTDEIPVINKEIGNLIRFHVLENRMQNVRIFISVDSPTGQPIISWDYGLGKSFTLSTGTALPWEGTYSVAWDGKLADGTYPSDGEHVLYVMVQDEDNNYSYEATHPFLIFNSELLSGYVDPPSGDSNSEFNYYVYYHDPDGTPPASAFVYIDSMPPRAMRFYGGNSAADGSYITDPPVQLSAGIHSYYFVFSAPEGGSIRLPGISTSPGPVVTASSQTYTFSVTKSGVGTVRSDIAGINCGNDCQETYATGTSVTLTAIAESSSTFLGWSGACTDSATTCKIIIDGNKNVSAVFGDSTGFLWSKTFTVGDYDAVYDIQQTSDGGYILVGYSGYSDALIIKLNPDGTVNWQKTYGGSSYDHATVVREISDGYIIAGSTESSGAGGSDAWVFMLNKSGDTVWQKTYGGSNNDYADTMQVLSDGYIIAGTTSSYGTCFGDAWIFKLDLSGNLLWQKTYGQNDSLIESIQQLPDGYVVVGSESTLAGGEDALVFKIDLNGNLVWQHTYGESNLDYAKSIQFVSDGYLVAGWTDSLGAGSFDAWIFKIDLSGNLLWQKTYGGADVDGVYSIREASGGFIVAGENHSSTTHSVLWLLKIDTNGTVEWERTYTRGNGDGAVTAQQTSDGGFIVAGTTYNTTNDIWVLKLDCNGTFVGCPNILVTPTALDFGSVGSTTNKQIIVANTGSGNLIISSISISGLNAHEFSQTNNCSTISPGSPCSITITFNPLSLGPKSAALTILSNDLTTPSQQVSLTGTSGYTTLSITKSGRGSGTVTSSPSGVNCGTDCSETYNQNIQLTLTAKPDINSMFAGWSGAACNGVRECTIDMNSDTTVTATFELIPPIADFEATTYTSGVFPLEISFRDLSAADPTSWLWNFGDGTSSTQQNPTHTYAHPGTYAVTLTVTNALGTSYANTVSKADYITVKNYTTYIITATASGGGIISPNGIVDTVWNSDRTFSITPFAGYHIAEVLIDGMSVDINNSYIFSNVSSNHTIQAKFASTTYTITASAGAGGNISPSEVQTFNYGANQTYNITPDAGYYVADVHVDGVPVGAVTQYAFANVSDDHTIEAFFSNAATHTITASAGSGGIITPSDVVTINTGGSQEFTIKPNMGYHVIDLLVDGISRGRLTSYSFENITTDHTITASFADKYTLTIVTAGTGTGIITSNPGGIACGADCAETYAQDTVVTLTVTPDPNVGFLGWYGACTGRANTCTVQMNGDQTVSAVFTNDSVSYWAKTYGTNDNDQAYASQPTVDGGFVIAGSTGSNAWVLKLDKYGKVEWQNTYGGSGANYAFSIQQTSDGGYVVGGMTSAYGRSDDAWVLKLAANGDIQWQEAFGESTISSDGAFSREWITSISQTREGGYVAAGGYESNDQYSPLILKIGPVSNDPEQSPVRIEWQKKLPKVNSIGIAYESFYSIQTTSDDGYILSGNDSKNLAHVIKLDAGGIVQWQRTYAGTIATYYDPEFIQQTPDGYILAGRKHTLSTSGTMTPTYSHCTSYDCKYGHDGYWSASPPATYVKPGEPHWYRFTLGSFDTTNKRPVKMTLKVQARYWTGPNDPNYWVAFNNKIVGTKAAFDNAANYTIDNLTISVSSWSEVTSILVTAASDFLLGEFHVKSVEWETIENSDAWILKLDANKNINWQKTYKFDQHNQVSSIQQTSDGGYIVGGVYYQVPPYKASFWMSKLDREGNIQWRKSHDGYDVAHSTNDYRLTPNVRQTRDAGYMMTSYTSYMGMGGNDVLLTKVNAEGNISGDCSILQTPSVYTGNGNAQETNADVLMTDANLTAISTDVTIDPTDVNPSSLCSLILSPPAGPTNLDAWPAYVAQINLSWTDNATDELGYTIERKIGDNSYASIATVGPGITAYSDAGLIPGVIYTYRIKAYNGIGDSQYSNEISAIPVSNPIPDISIIPYAWGFGTGIVNESSQSKVFTISNPGSGDLQVGTLFLNDESFAISNDTCTAQSVMPHGKCTFTVTFTPKRGGKISTSVAVPSNDPDQSQLNVQLEGIGQYRLRINRSGTGHGTVSSEPAGINCGSDCIELYDGGTSITLTAKPGDNSSLQGWFSEWCSGRTNPCTFTLSSHALITATFSCNDQPVRINRGNGAAFIQYQTLQEAYNAAQDNDVIEALSINFVENLSFNLPINVSIVGGFACGYAEQIGNSTIQGEITTADGTITLGNFEILSSAPGSVYYISAAADIGGAISPPGTAMVNQGGNQTFIVTPDAGYTITNVLVDGTSVGAVDSHTFIDITTNHTIEAFFTNLLTVSKAGTATGTVTSSSGRINCGTDCEEKYIAGTPETLMATPGPDAIFAGWSGGCAGTGNCDLQMNTDIAVTAIFDIAPPVADFTASPTNPGVIPFVPVVFTDRSLRAQHWTWDFGDGTTSTEPNPTHTYTTVGTYAVTLTVTNTTASDVETKVGYINVQAVPNLPVKVSGLATSYHSTLQEAYNAAANGDVIQTLAIDYMEDLNANRDIQVTLSGGYNGDYTSRIGVTTLLGQITTGAGTLIISDFVIAESSMANTYSIAAQADTGGSISPAGTIVAAAGAHVTFTITPDAGYTITKVLVDGESVGAVATYTLSDITSNHRIEALFTNKLVVSRTGTATGTVTSTPEGIGCGNDCEEKYIAGTGVTLSATADPGAIFSGWSGSGCTGIGDCATDMSTDVAVTAIFDVAPPVADFTATPTNPGVIPFVPVVFADRSVRAQSWLWDFGDGTTSTEQNPTHTYTTVGTYAVTLTVTNTTASDVETKVGYINVQAVPNLPVKVSGLATSYHSTLQEAYNAAKTGDVIQAFAITYMENLDANRDIQVTLSGGYNGDYTARIGVSTLQGQITTTAGIIIINDFVIAESSTMDSYAISARADIGGSISPSGTVVAARGTNETFTITPDPGYSIVNILVDGVSVGPVPTYTFSDITSNHTIDAVFTHLLRVSKSGTSTGTVSSTPTGIDCGSDCDGKFAAGTVVTLRAVPDPTAMFAGWNGSGCTGSVDCIITLNADTTVTVVFDTLLPTADFSASPTNPGVIPFVPVVFTDKSIRAQSWFWDFGDGTSSTEQNPTHTYTTVGSYTVSLTVTNTTGSNTKTVANYIVVQSCQNLPVKLSGPVTSYYSTLQAAYDAAANGDVIQMLAIDYSENLNANRNISVSLKGGYDCAYSSRIGTTALEGMIATRAGTLTVGDLVLVTGPADSYYTIAATAGLGGSISPPGTVVAAGGRSETFTVTPDPGHAIENVFVDEVSAGPVSTYTFADISADHRIEATFIVAPLLTISKSGSGAVISNPAGISCGSNCTSSFEPGATVTLTATPETDSIFLGWSGGCSGTGNCVVTMNENTTVTATFAPAYTLAVSKSGPGSGTVITSPAGINCGSNCAQSFEPGSIVTLTANPEADSIFLGWSGGGCTGTGNCIVMMNGSTTVTATFASAATLAISKSGPGSGTVTSTPIGINCGSNCAQLFEPGMTVTMTATPEADSVFIGWSGGGCTGTGNCVVTMNSNVGITASFMRKPDNIGVFSISSEWYLDENGNGLLDGAPIDRGYSFGGGLADPVPVTGDWNGSGTTKIGVYVPSTAQWYIDYNGNGLWDGTPTDRLYWHGFSGIVPVTGDWNGDGATEIGVYDPATAEWYLDYNGNGLWDGAPIDRLYWHGFSGVIPVTGDWNGDGITDIGVFNPNTDAEWYLDTNGSGAWDPGIDQVFVFGNAGDQPVIGDWNGDGISDFGVFRDNGAWYLDTNPDHTWGEGDQVLTFGVSGDKPVTGRWSLSAPDTIQVNNAGAGKGSVISSPAGINCGTDCLESYSAGTVVTLTATPDANSIFAGWSGGCTGTGNCVVTVTGNIGVAAAFIKKADNIGIVRFDNEWYLDRNGNGGWDSMEQDRVYAFGFEGCMPAAGDWNGDGNTEIGVFCEGTWYLDYNGNGIWDGTLDDRMYSFGGGDGIDDIPVTGDWNGDGITEIGVFRYQHAWYLDYNGNGAWDDLPIDRFASFGGGSDDIPVTGDWNGDGISDLGIFRDAGLWYLDINPDGTWGEGDQVFTFGVSGDIPVTGDWNNDGISDLGIFRGAGLWYLDTNPDRAWGEGDQVFTFGVSTDKPVTGRWSPSMPYVVNISKIGLGSGTVISSPAGINCGTDCSESYSAGMVVTLTATPDANSTFAGWSGGGCSGTGDCAITLNSNVTVTADFAADMTPPTGSVVINGGAAVTNSAAVTLTLNAIDDSSTVASMQFSWDNVVWFEWEPYITTRSATLSAGDGIKTIHVRFRDAGGSVSQVYTDSIVLDVTPPVGTIVINGDAASTNTREVTLSLFSTDANGVASMRFSWDNVTWYAWEAIAASRNATIPSSTPGTYTIRVQFRDEAGNVSLIYSDSIDYVP